ncbi:MULTISPECIES: hypothetical protein [Ehrlichia]|uniref:Uncharacterized protein n=1 Tax=Ehrlichia cf. muris str. EmCRT TaxID=1359167 RepID=A0A0F3NC76_9RICK|nr:MULTISPECIES: hypothetical protein [Ehrlichia]KJV65620.1 hypothetical protein EMUCRT_0565 [Ehrlichia cf. muris str. EmCRT]OUC04473.1 hypothetical protein DB91_02845 [Ehrlichia sp. Wisconsin_h]
MSSIIASIISDVSNSVSFLFSDTINTSEGGGDVVTNFSGNVVNGTLANGSNGSPSPRNRSLFLAVPVVGCCIILAIVLVLFCMLMYDCVARRRNRIVQHRRHMNHLREHGPGPDVPNVVMELDVIHNAQSSGNQSQCVESRPFICNHGGQENGDVDGQVRPVFRLQGIFPR